MSDRRTSVLFDRNRAHSDSNEHGAHLIRIGLGVLVLLFGTVLFFYALLREDALPAHCFGFFGSFAIALACRHLLSGWNRHAENGLWCLLVGIFLAFICARYAFAQEWRDMFGLGVIALLAFSGAAIGLSHRDVRRD